MRASRQIKNLVDANENITLNTQDRAAQRIWNLIEDKEGKATPTFFMRFLRNITDLNVREMWAKRYVRRGLLLEEIEFIQEKNAASG